MIWESSYWKDALLREARDLRRRKTQKRWPQQSFARLEQSVMMGFYIVRKLLEAKKLSQAKEHRWVRIERFKWNGKPVHYLNWHHLERFYDLSSSEKADKNIKFLCDQFVHSYIFQPLFSEDGLEGIFVTSDRERKQYLYLLPIDAVISLFEAVGKDYPSSGHLVWNPNKQDYDYTGC